MKPFLAIVALAAGASALAAGQSGVHREGDHWVQSTSGSESFGDTEQLRINCIGNIVVHGGAGSQIDYTVKRRVNARSEEQARNSFQEAGVQLTRQGRFMRLVLDDSAGSVDLDVTVPRRLAALTMGTEAGTLEARDLDGSVRAQTGGGDIRVARIKGSADLGTAGGSLHLGDIGGWVKATTAGGDITAESVGGESRLETAGGNISIGHVGGAVRAHTAGGKVKIDDAGGAVIAVTDGGSIEIGHAGAAVAAHNAGGGPIVVGSANGSVQCESASGAIKVGPVTSGAIRLSTASGSVAVELQNALQRDSTLSTGSGDITVYIPSNVGVMIRAQNEGSMRARGIVSDFPGLQIRMDGGSVSARGPINGGGPELRLECASGTIWIKRK